MERVLWRHYRAVAGVDEVGRGPLAGAVVAAAVVLPPDVDLPGVNDSKLMSEKQRDAAFDRIKAAALGWAVGVVGPERIDQINIRNAAFEAMLQALAGLPAACRAEAVLIDGNALLPRWDGPQRAVVGGDRKVLSIAAASIIAKVTRDRMCLEWEEQYPGYGFARHKGYYTREHVEAIARLGPSPIHRRTFIGSLQTRLSL